jgi:hypothetical protein
MRARIPPIALCLAALAASPPGAGAAVRAGSVGDPADRPPDVSGGPSRMPDLEQLRIGYDQEAGALTATVRFYQPVDVTAAGQRVYVGIGLPAARGGCSPGDAQVGADVAPAAGRSTYFVSGFTGPGDGTLSVSADKREMTLAFTSLQIARKDYRCFNAFTSAYDDIGHCGDPQCTFWSHIFVHDTIQTAFFDGFAPPPFVIPQIAACRDGEDNDGDGRTDFDEDAGCRGDPARASEADPPAVASRLALRATRGRCAIAVRLGVTPALAPQAVFPLGKVAVAVRGLSGSARRYTKSRQLALRDGTSLRFRSLRPGRYRVSAKYLGDRWRKVSAPRTRVVTVTGRAC